MIDDDDALELELRRAERLFDPVPGHLLEGAVAAFDMRGIDAELAELVFESSAELDTALVRGSDQPRLLTFQAGPVSVELEVFERGAGRWIVGRLTPAAFHLAYRQGGQEAPVPVDDLGRFIIGSVGPGPMRLHCRPAGGSRSRPVVTEWFLA